MKFSKTRRLLRRLTWHYRSAKAVIRRPDYTPYETVYPLQIIRWQPNTCECIILQTIDRTNNYSHRRYVFYSYEKRCKKHKHLFGMRLFDSVRRENQLVNISRNNSKTPRWFEKPIDPLMSPFTNPVVKCASQYYIAFKDPQTIDKLIEQEVENFRPVKIVNYSGNK